MDPAFYTPKPRGWEAPVADPDTLDLFGSEPNPPMYSPGDRETSREAAEALDEKFLSGLRVEVYRAILASGDDGITDKELEDLPIFIGRALGPSTLRKRRTELLQRGYLEAHGKRDGATVWRLPAGER